MKTFKTPKGTELPLLDLRGKDYLQVAWRIVWFREENPGWGIVTSPIKMEQDYTIFRADIINENDFTISTAHKREDAKHFQDHAEKAETGAIGRALANCGYGTQFAPDLDEGERIVDSPVNNPRLATREQLMYLLGVAKQKNITPEEVKNAFAKIGVTDSTMTPITAYNEILKELQGIK